MDFNHLYEHFVEPDGSGGIANRHGIVCPGIETRCGRDFPHMSRATLGPIQPRVQWVPYLFWG